METLVAFITDHADHAHWFIFGGMLLAGINIPISIDALVIIGALSAATVIPEHTTHLFLALLFGCYFSAMIAYWIGRLLGPKLCTWAPFSKIFNPARLEKARSFYQKYGLWTLLIGRFIPFGARNCIFMTTGFSKSSFIRFILRDALACLFWVSTCFYLFYTVGQNYEILYHYVKAFNILIFSAFSAAIIGIVWYKKRKKPC
jgi:membrane-associated protein